MLQLLDGIRILRVDRAEADQLLRMAIDVGRHVLVRHQHADVPRAEAEHDGAIHGRHRCPVRVEVDGDLAGPGCPP